MATTKVAFGGLRKRKNIGDDWERVKLFVWDSTNRQVLGRDPLQLGKIKFTVCRELGINGDLIFTSTPDEKGNFPLHIFVCVVKTYLTAYARLFKASS